MLKVISGITALSCGHKKCLFFSVEMFWIRALRVRSHFKTNTAVSDLCEIWEMKWCKFPVLWISHDNMLNTINVTTSLLSEKLLFILRFSTMTFNSFIKWSFLKIQFKWVIDDGKGDLKTGEMGNEQINYSVWMRISLNSMWTRQVDTHSQIFQISCLGPAVFLLLLSVFHLSLTEYLSFLVRSLWSAQYSTLWHSHIVTFIT